MQRHALDISNTIFVASFHCVFLRSPNLGWSQPLRFKAKHPFVFMFPAKIKRISPMTSQAKVSQWHPHMISDPWGLMAAWRWPWVPFPAKVCTKQPTYSRKLSKKKTVDPKCDWFFFWNLNTYSKNHAKLSLPDLVLSNLSHSYLLHRWMNSSTNCLCCPVISSAESRGSRLEWKTLQETNSLPPENGSLEDIYRFLLGWLNLAGANR